MARTITTETLNAGSLVVIRRTRRTCIEATAAGVYSLTAEREEVTQVNGVIVGAPRPCESVTISHSELIANPAFAAVQAAISSAIDAKDIAREAARAAAAAEAAAQEGG